MSNPEEVSAGQDLSISWLVMEATAADEAAVGNTAGVESVLRADTGILDDLRESSPEIKMSALMATHVMATLLVNQLAEATGRSSTEIARDVASRLPTR